MSLDGNTECCEKMERTQEGVSLLPGCEVVCDYLKSNAIHLPETYFRLF